MNGKKKLLVFLLGFILFFLVFKFEIKADSCDSLSGQQKIDCLTGVLLDLSAKSKTLQNQIAQFNTQIYLTQLKINQTQEQIALLGGRIDQLETSLQALSDAFSSRAVATYKMTRSGETLFLLLSSGNLTQTIERFHYLQRAQVGDHDLLVRLQGAQNIYKENKTEQEKLEAKLAEQKLLLDTQKKDKSYLLTVTRNDEKKYQDLLAQALAEQGAIQRAISVALELLASGGGTPISAGDTVGVIGNSGAPDCSSGSHLHFTILKNGGVQNPADYLKNISVEWSNQPDGSFGFGGSWDWPILAPRITQGFGMTYWARLGWYGGRIHDGVDMVSRESDIIKAPKSGKIVRGTTVCDNPNIAGVSNLKYAAISHEDGVVTVYLHIQ